jgi:hypothetical chaperone protein
VRQHGLVQPLLREWSVQQIRRQSPVVGIDFGTTNSSVALAMEDATVQLASFSIFGQETSSFRSVVYLEQREAASGSRKLHSSTGPQAIERYLDAEHKGRLIQSLKSYLPSRTFTGTSIFGRHYTLEPLIAKMLTDLREQAERQFGTPIRHALAGRPVRFVGGENDADDAYAVSRLRDAFTLAGFESVEFEFEPIAAAYSYESTLDRDELILIGDFGGGTSDFCLVRVGPGVRSRGRSPQDMLGISGVALAGDAFDARIVRKLVSPALGSNSFALSLNKSLPALPAWIYSNLERWHYLSFLRTRNVTELLRGARARALEPEKILALSQLIEEDLGYQLHQAVQKVKCELSYSDNAEFAFSDGSMDLHIPVTRCDFEGWITDELHAIEASVDSLLQSCGIAPGQVDRVFLTGGSSFVPAVRRIFNKRFGKDRVQSGNEFTSVASGLALSAAHLSS